MDKKRNYLGYNIISNLIKLFGDIYFGGKVIGKENIPKEGKCILAGNHTSDFDSYLLYKSTKRKIHLLAKKELFTGPFSFIFKTMHLIPVDRSAKNPAVKEEVINLLNDNKIIGIFPEGTYHKKDIILPFKPGVVSFANKTNAPIIPFVIIGKFTFRSHPKIIFGKPIYLSKITNQDQVTYLENIIRNIYKKNSSPN